MDPVTGLTLARAAAEMGKKLYEVIKGVKDHDTKRKLDEILDELSDLKRQASELEDQNRELRDKLRFKSDDYEFKTPFYYEKTHPELALCPTCFTNEKVAPVAEARDGIRRCLNCDKGFVVQRGRSYDSGPYGGGGGQDDWMKM